MCYLPSVFTGDTAAAQAAQIAWGFVYGRGLYSLGETRICYVEQTGFELEAVLLSLPPECWSYRLELVIPNSVGLVGAGSAYLL